MNASNLVPKPIRLLKQGVVKRLNHVRTTRELRRRLRSGDEYALPSTVIIGAQKAATSSLYAYLTEHPRMNAGLWKEVRYFSSRFRSVSGAVPPVAEGELAEHRRRYSVWFGPAGGAGTAPRHYLDATPEYLLHPHAATVANAVVPGAKYIALLRDPVSRAFSHYLMEVRRGTETLGSLAAAAEAEPGRVDADFERARRDPGFWSDAIEKHTYLMRGRYHEQLTRWFDAVGRENVLVVSSEALRRETQATVDRVFDFIGLDRVTLLDARERHVARQRASLDDASRSMLVEHFRPHNEALFELLGERFDWQ